MLSLGREVSVRRRDFIKVIGVLVGWPAPLVAQEAGRTYRVAFLNPSRTFWAVLRAEFRRSSFIEGQNLVIDEREYAQDVE